MEKRKQSLPNQQTATAEQRGLSSNNYRVQNMQNKKSKNTAQARREKKERRRVKKAATQGDAMEIG